MTTKTTHPAPAVLRCAVEHWSRRYTIEVDSGSAMDIARHWLDGAANLAELLPGLAAGDFTRHESESAAGVVSELIRQATAVIDEVERGRSRGGQ